MRADAILYSKDTRVNPEIARDLEPMPIANVQVELDTNATGQLVYRHVLRTEWSIVPAP